MTPKEIDARFEQLDEELAVMRGPVPLKHKQPVDAGELGRALAFNRLGRRVLLALVPVLLGASGGLWYAVKERWVSQGRDMEVKRQEAEWRRSMECRIHLMERRYLAPSLPGVVPPDPCRP